MNVVKKIEQYDSKHIYFCEPIKNNIIQDGSFIRILYFTGNMSLNGIYLMIYLKKVSIEKYYNKVKYLFSVEENMEMIEKIKNIEENILNKISYTMGNKTPQYNIYDNFIHQNIKMHMNNFTEESMTYSNTPYFVLKISGIWSTEQHYGLTYKHFQPYSLLQFTSFIEEHQEKEEQNILSICSEISEDSINNIGTKDVDGSKGV
jgi:hypothetical protein